VALILVLFPGFVRFAWYYYVTCNRESVRYGNSSCRQTLDVYLSHRQSVQDPELSTLSLLKQPVVVYFTGGAWLIGYKMWGALLARTLTAAGILVILPDYRNYPWGVVPEQVQDVQAALKWTIEHAEEYGGDPEKIVVVGQSAGGHLAMTALLRLAVRGQLQSPSNQDDPGTLERSGEQDLLNEEGVATVSFAARDFKGFISLSAPYCLTAMQQSFVRFGLDAALIDRIFGCDKTALNPHLIVEECNSTQTSLDQLLPPIRLFHGTRDKTVPHDGSVDFYRELEQAGVDVQFHSYEGWSHTDAILESPMDADHRFHRDIFAAVQEWTDDAADSWPDESSAVMRRLCPHFLIRFARFLNPF
jgi:prenylcysteine alpha-carboxyl methylesterase